MKRIFLFVLDSCGCGEMPDAASFGDINVNTLKRISVSPYFRCDNMRKLGLGNIPGCEYIGPVEAPLASVGRMTERSAGKDTTIGHWEISGLISDDPLPTYPNGFPEDVIAEFEKQTGRGVLCNLPYSGTEVIKDYGEEHLRTGKLIVYTSADSVFQIAAHKSIVPVEDLYEYCRIARKILCGKHSVGRVIARPFDGEYPFTRTAERHDFSLEPTGTTLLDVLSGSGKTVYAIGKIYDIFAGRGITEHVFTHSNTEGLSFAQEALKKNFDGLCFINLVDFDSQYGHRRDVDGYAKAFAQFDAFLPDFIGGMRDDDVLMITADHGCDPGYAATTDHTREYTPFILYSKSLTPVNFGTRETFADIAATVAYLNGTEYKGAGTSVISEPELFDMLSAKAIDMTARAYVPYSNYTVGAALLCSDGSVYTGCNIENASYTPTVCAERTAFFKAVSEGKRNFSAIAVAGGKNGRIEGEFPPCGVCRQVMAEFCTADFKVLIVTGNGQYKVYRLGDLLPNAFGPGFMKE